MAIIHVIFFAFLTLVGFAIWQRFGIAVLAALVYGSLSIADSRGDIRLEIASPARQMASSAGYWCLSVVDWLGYMGVLCFGTALVIEMF